MESCTVKCSDEDCHTYYAFEANSGQEKKFHPFLDCTDGFYKVQC